MAMSGKLSVPQEGLVRRNLPVPTLEILDLSTEIEDFLQHDLSLSTLTLHEMGELASYLVRQFCKSNY